MRASLFAIISFLFVNSSLAQPANPSIIPADKKLDSLLLELKKAKEDTNKVNTLHEIYLTQFKNKNYSEAAKYTTEAWALAKKLHYIKGEARCMVNKAYECQVEKKWEEILTYSLPAAELLKNIDDTRTKARCAIITGNSYYFRTIYPEAIKYLLESNVYWKELGNESVIISINLRLSECMFNLGNYTLAFEKAYEALGLSIKLGDKSLEEASNISVSASYFYSKKNTEARKFLEKALKINQVTGNHLQFAKIQNSLAEISITENKFHEAGNYLSTALKIYESPGGPRWGKQWCYTLFGQLNEARGDSAFLKNNKKYAAEFYRKAIKDFTTALKLCEDIHDNVLITEKYIFLGSTYRKLYNYNLSRAFLLKAIAPSKELRVKDFTAKCYNELSQLDSMEGNFKSAFENSKLYKIYSDSLALEMDKGKIETFTIQAEINSKEEEIKLLAAENKLKTTQSEKESQKKKFMFTGFSVFLLLGGYGFYRYRRYKKMEMEQVKLKDRLHISQGLHDDIGSTLSSISVYSQVAQRLSQNNEKAEMADMLGKISDTSNEMVSEMSDIVWAIHPKNDSMEKIIQRMESYAKPMLATRNIHFRLIYQPSILSARLDMEKRKNLYLIFKEVVNNAFKYAGCTEIFTELTHEYKGLQLNIYDNGVGFDVLREMAGNKPTLSGNGLRNIQMRASDMKGELQIVSSPGQGTKIKLIIPIP